ncbi:MAG: hypothetical protein ACK41T_05555 [Pseudobdellovibrio sp.]
MKTNTQVKISALFLILYFFSCFALSDELKLNKMSKKEQKISYLSLDLDYSFYKKTVEQLNTHLKTSLKNRGEAHITVITPPEFKIITEKISSDSLKQEWVNWKNKNFENICIGSGSIKTKGKTISTYYVVTKAESLFNFRQYLKSKYKLDHFNAELFFPHITLGFTDRDLHYEDGVQKDIHSCLNLDIKLPEGHK